MSQRFRPGVESLESREVPTVNYGIYLAEARVIHNIYASTYNIAAQHLRQEYVNRWTYVDNQLIANGFTDPRIINSWFQGFLKEERQELTALSRSIHAQEALQQTLWYQAYLSGPP